MAFLYRPSAFDAVYHEKPFHKLSKMGVSAKLLQSLASMYRDGRNKIKRNGNFSKFYAHLIGVRRGDPLAPVLFLLYIVFLTGRTSPICIGKTQLFCLKYAEDIVLRSPDTKHLQESVDRVMEFSKKHDFVLNVKKSFFLAVKGR